MNYLDFDLEIGVGRRSLYPVFIVGSPAGEAHEFIQFPFNGQELENQLFALQSALFRSGAKYRKILSPEEQTVQNFGRALFDALFIGEVRSCYEVSQREAYHQGKGLRLKLRIQPPELASLPWEFLYDKKRAEYICLSNNTPIVRYLDLPQPPRPLAVTPPLSILGIIASPNNLSALDIEREKYRVEKSLEALCNRGLVRLTWLSGRTWQHLQREMRIDTWHIFHFIGHGGFNEVEDEGMICLEDNEGNACDLPATNLGRLLTDHRSLRLVVLNSCDGAKGSKYDIFSSTAATLVRRGISAVLAMQYEITDTAAIELSRVFYETLADGLPVDMAVSEARKAISVGIKNSLEWGTPVLYMRSPDGILFNLPQNSTRSQNEGQSHKSPSIDEQVSLWMQAKAKREMTKRAYEHNIKSFREVLHKHNLDLNSDDVPTISSIFLDWANQGIRRKNISNSTFNQRRSIILSFYRFALKQHWMKNNPLEEVESLDEQSPNAAKPLNSEKVKNALDAIDRSKLDGKRDYALLLLLLTTGRWPTEVVALRCSDIVIGESGMTITFRHCRGGKTIVLTLPKATATTQALLDYLMALYGNEWPADAPIWISVAWNNTKGQALGTSGISGVCERRLGTSKVLATSHTFAKMRNEATVKEIEGLLNTDGFVSTEQPKLFS